METYLKILYQNEKCDLLVDRLRCSALGAENQKTSRPVRMNLSSVPRWDFGLWFAFFIFSRAEPQFSLILDYNLLFINVLLLLVYCFSFLTFLCLCLFFYFYLHEPLFYLNKKGQWFGCSCPVRCRFDPEFCFRRIALRQATRLLINPTFVNQNHGEWKKCTHTFPHRKDFCLFFQKRFISATTVWRRIVVNVLVTFSIFWW